MTTNDPGHINNLDASQVHALKELWLLLEKFLHDPSNAGYQAEIFRASAYDNPDMILLRWLRARKWDIYAAYQQLIDTFRWRQEWHVADLVSKGESDLSAEELQSGKSFFTGPDREGRPINYVSAKDHIKGQFSAESTEKITVFAMETGRKLLRAPHEAVTVVFDMTNFGLKNMDYPHMRFLINLLQNHYPESFTLGLVVNAPWVFNGCWYMIKPWLDPVVENKIRFVNSLDELSQFIDPSVLPKHLNGTHAAFQYLSPTDEDLAMQAAFRNDHEGKRAAEDEHRQAAEEYLHVTLRWARGDDSEQVREERTRATKRLRDAFEQLVPYIHTRTHYHRAGVIDEPIFEVAYRRLREKNGE